MAKKFRFRADAVLRQREHVEKQALQRLSEAQARVSEIENRIRQLHADLKHQDELVRDGVLTGQVDVHYMGLYRRHVMALHRQVMEQAELLRSAATELHEARVGAAEAIKHRKALSILKDKLKRRHIEGIEHAEQLASDEMNTLRFNHGRLNEDADA